MTSAIAEAARGRWASLLPQLGVSPRALSGKHGPCPICGGRDRFRFDNRDGRGTWICSQCGAGDGLSLAMKVTGHPFKDLARQIKDLVGSAPIVTKAPGPTPEQLRQAKNRLWCAAKPVEPGDAVDRYLLSRGLADRPACLRHAPQTPFDGLADLHPAMVALVHGPDARPATLHRTFLTPDGRKAKIPSPRRLMRGPFPKGSAVRLVPATDVLGVAEGIETAMAAAQFFKLPVWAALTAGNLADWIWPNCIRQLIVFGDNDGSFTGQNAAFALARRAKAKGIAVEVQIPPKVGADWADVLLDEAAAGSAARATAGHHSVARGGAT
jgi:putative DNA primase/helicase